jgi:acyl-CoA thioester hydrolase
MIFRWPIRVYYEDTDSGGVVYYANYLKFMERARTEWLRKLGFEQDRMQQEEGVIFAVRHVDIDYLRPARFNEELEVTSKLIEQKRASLTFAQTVQLVGDDFRPCCTAEVRIACIDTESFRPTAIPTALMKELSNVR